MIPSPSKGAPPFPLPLLLALSAALPQPCLPDARIKHLGFLLLHHVPLLQIYICLLRKISLLEISPLPLPLPLPSWHSLIFPSIH